MKGYLTVRHYRQPSGSYIVHVRSSYLGRSAQVLFEPTYVPGFLLETEARMLVRRKIAAHLGATEDEFLAAVPAIRGIGP